MAHFLQGMAAQLLLLIIFTHKSDALVSGFLLLVFLSIKWAFANRELLVEQNKGALKNTIVPANYKPPTSANSTTSIPVSLKFGKAEFQINWD